MSSATLRLADQIFCFEDDFLEEFDQLFALTFIGIVAQSRSITHENEKDLNLYCLSLQRRFLRRSQVFSFSPWVSRLFSRLLKGFRCL